MGEFFHGWRRKVGCILLVMALALTGAWIRSFCRADWFAWFTVNTQGRRQQNGLVILVLAMAFMGGWLRSYVNQYDLLLEVRGDESQHLRSHDGAICWVYRVWSRINGVREEKLFSIPYWSITIPLTLLSAYLLLAKPRPSNQKKISEPVPAGGA